MRTLYGFLRIGSFSRAVLVSSDGALVLLAIYVPQIQRSVLSVSDERARTRMDAHAHILLVIGKESTVYGNNYGPWRTSVER